MYGTFSLSLLLNDIVAKQIIMHVRKCTDSKSEYIASSHFLLLYFQQLHVGGNKTAYTIVYCWAEIKESVWALGKERVESRVQWRNKHKFMCM